jgi:hypothetical protein
MRNSASEIYDLGPIDRLVKEYAEWNTAQGISLGSADEHIFDEELSNEQRAWLRAFILRWDAAVETEDAWAEAEREEFLADDCDHEWAFTGTAYGGDDDRYHGEGRCYCAKCGADGDA